MFKITTSIKLNSDTVFPYCSFNLWKKKIIIEQSKSSLDSRVFSFFVTFKGWVPIMKYLFPIFRSILYLYSICSSITYETPMVG